MAQLDLHIESLEQRQMLAGDVSVQIRNGDLVVDGDQASNSIVVHASDDTDTFFVQGIAGTTINGRTGQLFSGVNDDFRINLRGGNNEIVLTPYVSENSDVTRPFRIADDLTIRTAGGNDLVMLGTITVFGDAQIRTGGGNDAVFMLVTTISHRSRLVTGGGDDFVYVADIVVGDDLNLSTGGGSDVVIGFYQVADNMTLALGGGDDLGILRPMLVGGNHTVRGGGGTDRLVTSAESPGMIDGVGRVVSTEEHDQLTNSEVNVEAFGASVGKFVEFDDLLERFLNR